MRVIESPVPRRLTVINIANRPKRSQIKLHLWKSATFRRVFNRANKTLGHRLNTDEGYFAEKWHVGKDQSANKAEGGG